MALMWPRILPSWVIEDDRRSAEIKVYRKLAAILDDGWRVYYSRPWWGLNKFGAEVDGEADFILAHALLGVIFIEVKGGRISYDPGTDHWHSTDRNGIRHRIKDPVEQAKVCRYRFLERLKKSKRWPTQRVVLRYGVIFTDTLSPTSDTQSLGSYSPELFCHSAEFEKDLEAWLLKRLHNDLNGEIGPGDLGLMALKELVANPVTLTTTMRRESEEELASMERLLTGVQLQVLLELKERDAALVEGGAGSGKTVIAVELAKSFASESLRVFFVGVGEPFISHLGGLLGGYVSVEVLSYLDFVRVGESTRLASNDVIIVDESQDIDNSFWNYLENIDKGDSPRIFVFMDSNQAVYRSPEDLSSRLKAEKYQLRINLRNTKKIANITKGLYEGPVMRAFGPVGSVPIVRQLSSFEVAINETLQIIYRLVLEESVDPYSVAILARESHHLDRLKPGLISKRVPYSSGMIGGGQAVTLESVGRFKGLEAAFVILLADRELATNAELSYVAISRARTHLFVIGNIQDSILERALHGDAQIDVENNSRVE